MSAGGYATVPAVDDLEAFRQAAGRHGVPEAALEWWTRLARPRLELTAEGTGPVIGWFGGEPDLPDGPADLTFLAAVDLSAVPEDSHDLDLPAEGFLLFYSEEDLTPEESAVVHVPELGDVPGGTPLYGRTAWTLPEERGQSTLDLGDPGHDEESIRDAMRELAAPEDVLVVIGGYGDEATSGVGSPVDNPADQVLLAQTFMSEEMFGQRFGGSEVCIVSFLMTPGDLADRAFGQCWLFSDFLG